MDLYKTIFIFSLLWLTMEGKSLKKNNVGEPFELNEFLFGTFSARSLNASWISENTLIYKDRSGNFRVFDAQSKNSTELFDKTIFDAYPSASIGLSTDHLFVLIRYNVSSVFRHSTTALYAIYDIENNEYYDIAERNHIQYAQWAPQGHSLVYVYLNNIYYLENPKAEPKAITTDGEPGIIYNGVPDWVYEEEVLGSGYALWFSPDAKNLAFASFNDTNVENFSYFLYEKADEEDDLYPHEITIKYPKVGTTNPDVKTYIINLEDSQNSPIELEAINKGWLPDDYVLFGIKWINNDELTVLYTNRIQNKAELVRCTKDAICEDEPEATYEEENGWLDPAVPVYNQEGTQKIEILGQPQGNDSFDHLVLTDVKTKTTKRLMEGPFYVLAINGWDEDKNLVYYTRSGDNEPSERQIYVLNLESVDSKCLTCGMTTSRGACKYAGASFGRNFKYVAKVCQGLGPYVSEIQNLDNESDTFLWEDNAALTDKLKAKMIPVIKNLKVPVGDGTFHANVRLLLPPNLDENSDKKYPAVVYVYAGPNSNLISDAYSSGFQNYIVTNREYIYIYIDGRGSGRDGKNKMFQLYKNLATVEIEDQITVTKWLQDNLSYIDANRTGIWGWSYGGFSTAWALVKDTENVFRFGLSVAPVTGFIYYDSIYTERYMGLPDDNAEGYNNTDVSLQVEALRGKLFFLIHGNADDNVHYQQSMLLSKALQQADILFQQQSYPDENHNLAGVYAHLYHTIDRFWARSFGLPDPPLTRLMDPEKETH